MEFRAERIGGILEKTKLDELHRATSRSRAGWGAFLVLAAAWAVSLAVLAANGRPVEEQISLFVVLGLVLPAIALLLCRGLPALPPPRAIRADKALIAGLAVLVMLFLAVKGPLLAALTGPAPDPRVRDVVNTLLKLAVFVAVPLAVYALRGKIFPRQLGLTWPPEGPRGRSLLAFVTIGAVFTGIQIFFGRGIRPLLDGSLASRHWALGLLLCFLWMSVEAGLVEEVFFRVILQSRLAAVTRSQAAGIFLSALVFGLAHAPGLWLRSVAAGVDRLQRDDHGTGGDRLRHSLDAHAQLAPHRRPPRPGRRAVQRARVHRDLEALNVPGAAGTRDKKRAGPMARPFETLPMLSARRAPGRPWSAPR